MNASAFVPSSVKIVRNGIAPASRAAACASSNETFGGNAVPLAWTGGDLEGGLGTNVAGILEAIEVAWSPAGVAILVDLGGAETNSEMAVEMLPEDRRARVVVCNAPVVEGAVIAATESSGGSSLMAVQRSAEEFYA